MIEIIKQIEEIDREIDDLVNIKLKNPCRNWEELGDSYLNSKNQGILNGRREQLCKQLGELYYEKYKKWSIKLSRFTKVNYTTRKLKSNE